MKTCRYSGHDFSEDDLQTIRTIIQGGEHRSRTAISRAVCTLLDWRKPNGTLKDMSCRVALLRMQDDGLIVLPPAGPKPPARKPRPPGLLAPESTLFTPEPIRAPLSALRPIQVRPIASRQEGRTWNDLMDRHHYLGYSPLPGAQLRYVVESSQGLIALLGFGAAAWALDARDYFIGWTPEQRKRNLHLVVNNARFLILPWVQVPHLASHVLAAVARRLPDDWQDRYAYRPVLLETFVELHRFSGTSYKAANWIRVGTTLGLGKKRVYGDPGIPLKDIFLYPLVNNFDQILCQP
jgi:hypothetical protein